VIPVKRVAVLRPIVLASLVVLSGQSPAPAVHLTSAQWQADLAVLADALPKKHVDPFRRIDRATFEQRVRTIHDRIPALRDDEIVVAFAGLVASIGDGHTSFDPADQTAVDVRWVPLELYDFDDGLYPIAAPRRYASMLGHRITKIDGHDIADVFLTVSRIISSDNDMEYRYTVPDYVIRPQILSGLGLGSVNGPTIFSQVGSADVTLPQESEHDYASEDWVAAGTFAARNGSPGLDKLFATPLTMPHYVSRDAYWYAPVETAMYFQYNRCFNQPGREPFAKVAADFLTAIGERHAERAIVDLRNNPGGDPDVARPLIDGLRTLRQSGALRTVIVLVGRRTFSAALTNAAALRKDGAIIAGERSRGKPNNPSEGRNLKLPNSRANVSVSTQFVARDPALGDAPYLPVDLVVPNDYAHYATGADKVLDVALHYRDRTAR
jgi:hypothetical protein